MKLCESFNTIQGEGKYAGLPVHLIRLHGCNLDCKWCDSTHTTKFSYIEIFPRELYNQFKDGIIKTILWTGGEPCLQLKEIMEVLSLAWHHKHHIETNGTILSLNLRKFDYVAFSPKDKSTAESIIKFIPTITGKDSMLGKIDIDIKVVTDMKTIGVDMLDLATVLMPLTTGNLKADLVIKKDVWKYCVTNNIRYSSRIHLGVE